MFNIFAHYQFDLNLNFSYDISLKEIDKKSLKEGKIGFKLKNRILILYGGLKWIHNNKLLQ